jgi:hypothetical protein
MAKKKSTSAALKYVHRRFFAGQPEGLAEIEEAPSVVSLLEDDDYDGHTLAMLRRIATALNKRVEIRFVSLRSRAAREQIGWRRQTATAHTPVETRSSRHFHLGRRAALVGHVPDREWRKVPPDLARGFATTFTAA